MKLGHYFFGHNINLCWIVYILNYVTRYIPHIGAAIIFFLDIAFIVPFVFLEGLKWAVLNLPPAPPPPPKLENTPRCAKQYHLPTWILNEPKTFQEEFKRS